MARAYDLFCSPNIALARAAFRTSRNSATDSLHARAGIRVPKAGNYTVTVGLGDPRSDTVTTIKPNCAPHD